MYKILIKTKLLEGKYLEIREYEMGKDLKVIHCTDPEYQTHDHSEEEYMILTVAQQKKGKVTNTQQSKFPPYKYYRLYKFLWKGKKEIIEEEVPNVLQSMSEYATGDKWEELRKRLHS